jgi:hypothetical protein
VQAERRHADAHDPYRLVHTRNDAPAARPLSSANLQRRPVGVVGPAVDATWMSLGLPGHGDVSPARSV